MKVSERWLARFACEVFSPTDDARDGADARFDGPLGGAYPICWEGEGKVSTVSYTVTALPTTSACDMCVWIAVKSNCARAGGVLFPCGKGGWLGLRAGRGKANRDSRLMTESTLATLGEGESYELGVVCVYLMELGDIWLGILSLCSGCCNSTMWLEYPKPRERIE